MIVSETDSRPLWCPFVRVGEQANGAAENRPDGSFHCLGSQCMAWRWQPLQADDAFKNAVKKAREDLGETDKASQAKAVQHVIANRAEYGLPTKPYLGFCGLAGIPEK